MESRTSRRDFLKILAILPPVVYVTSNAFEVGRDIDIEVRNESNYFDVCVDESALYDVLKVAGVDVGGISKLKVVIIDDRVDELDLFGASNHVQVDTGLGEISIMARSLYDIVCDASVGKMKNDEEYVAEKLPTNLFSHAVFVGCLKLYGERTGDDIDVSNLGLDYFNNLSQDIQTAVVASVKLL